MQLRNKVMTKISTLLALLAIQAGVVQGAAVLNKARAGMSPVSRVVELLQGMTSRIEADGKAEEDLYENFVCWATSIIRQKRETNAAAQSRADSLGKYIDDLTSGRIELTTERVDLEKELETLNGDLEIAKQSRDKEAKDFSMAKDEMNKAIDAVTKAIEVLRTATQGHEDGVLMSLKGSLSESSEVRAQERAALGQAIELGKRVLTKGDFVFLQRLLSADVPARASWKKLNRNATFKMSYKARSFKIQDVLAKLQENLATNLQEAEDKESKAKALYTKLSAAKTKEKNAAEDALRKLTGENGAKSSSLSESQDEKTALEKQISDDEGYIAQVQQSLAEKKSEWKARQDLRAGELAAISKAISILHGDDARDLFKRSFASQGFLFLQEGAERNSQRIESAVKALNKAAQQTRDSRVADLAKLAASGYFDQIIQAIDSMLQVLRTEEASDLTEKETCESERATDTRDAIQTSRAMDELTDTITTLTAKIAELTAEIDDKQAQVDAIDKQLSEIAEERKKENAEYITSKKDDEDAAVLVANARTVLNDFYTSNGLMLVQNEQARSSQTQPFESQAGEAPPPPPQTWKNPTYGGKTDESTGILAILDMIESDIRKDITKADKEEADSLALYTKTKNNLDTQRTALTTSIGSLTSDKSTAIGEKQTASQGRTLKKGELAVVMKKIQDAVHKCDFVTINFHSRSQNRKIEIDGLEEAKAILSGGVFDGLPDPDREMKPGDALVQYPNRQKFLHRLA